MLTVRRKRTCNKSIKDWLTLYKRIYDDKKKAFTAAARLLTGDEAIEVFVHECQYQDDTRVGTRLYASVELTYTYHAENAPFFLDYDFAMSIRNAKEKEGGR